jgi:Xaa-Pro aminopeptidase
MIPNEYEKNDNLLRIRRTQDLIRERKIDALLSFEPENVHYLTGAIPDAFILSSARAFVCVSLFIPEEGEPEVFVLSMDHKKAKKQSWIKNVKSYNAPPRGDAMSEAVRTVKVRGFGKARIGVEKNFLTVFQFEALQEALPEVTFLDASDLIPILAASKSPTEVQNIEKAINIAFMGMKAALSSVKEGVSELEIAAEADMVMKKNGSQRNASTTLVASGVERNLLSHPFATEKKIMKNELIVIDLGVVYNGYCSDLCRTAVFGKPTVEQKRVFQAVLDAQSAGIEAAKVGLPTGRMADFVGNALRKNDLERFAPEMMGHGIGLKVHQYPRIFPNAPFIIPENATLALLETAPFVPGLGSIRLEDITLVTSEGSTILGDQSVPRELISL